MTTSLYLNIRFIFIIIWIVCSHLSALRLKDPGLSLSRAKSKADLSSWLQKAAKVFSLSSSFLISNSYRTIAVTVISPDSTIQQSVQVTSNKDREIFQSLRQSSLLNDPNLLLPSFSTPTDDFWYPPFLLGRWKTDLTFDYAEFQPQLDSVAIEMLRRSLPGLSDDPSDLGSLIFQAANTGKDIPRSNLMLRFVSLDGHPREDHPYNLKHLVAAFTDNHMIIDKAPYSFQKQHNWIYSPANRWTINFHMDDSAGQGRREGKIDLETIKRKIFVETGFAETTEFFRQTRELATTNGPPMTSHSTYAVNWQLGSEKALKGEFISPVELASTDTVYGKLNFVLFFEPTDEFYVSSQLGAQPAAVLSYNVKMQRYLEDGEGSEVEVSSLSPSQRQQLTRSEMKRISYPYIPRWGVGPVELDQFFGY